MHAFRRNSPWRAIAIPRRPSTRPTPPDGTPPPLHKLPSPTRRLARAYPHTGGFVQFDASRALGAPAPGIPLVAIINNKRAVRVSIRALRLSAWAVAHADLDDMLRPQSLGVEMIGSAGALLRATGVTAKMWLVDTTNRRDPTNPAAWTGIELPDRLIFPKRVPPAHPMAHPHAHAQSMPMSMPMPVPTSTPMPLSPHGHNQPKPTPVPGSMPTSRSTSSRPKASRP